MELSKRGFKKKTIAKAIRTKISEWIATLPKELQDEVKHDYIVTGGAIASMLLGDLPNDYDVYFQHSNIAVKVADYYLNLLANSSGFEGKRIDNGRVSRIEAVANSNSVSIMVKSAGVLSDGINADDYQYFEQLPTAAVESYFKHWSFNKPRADDKPTYKPAFITSNAITLHDGIQIILRFCGEPAQIHKNFDFIHCTNIFTNEGLFLNQEALEMILAKELKYFGSRYPICSLFRIRKFLNRGWSITAGEIFKIAYDVSKLDLNDKNVLRDQLVGVDAAYFTEVLDLLKSHEGDLDRTYLFEIVNRVFDSEDFDEFNYMQNEE